MKKLIVAKIERVPKNLVERDVALTMLADEAAYYFTKKHVQEVIKEYNKEVKRFIKLRNSGGVDRVAEATETLKRNERLLRYMEENGLDIILIDDKDRW
jgi:hypothetical protein